jgi:hypothetical protein
MRSLLALVVLVWLGLTCANLPAEESALAPERARLATASEAALARLGPDAAPAAAPPVPFPPDAGPALRALRATGRGEEVAALEAALERAARLALADAGPRVAEAAAGFDPSASAAPGAEALASFRAAVEPELRAALEAAAAQRLGDAGAPAALEGVRNAAGRLPLPREVSLDLVSIVTDQAVASFFNALADELRRLDGERVARED